MKISKELLGVIMAILRDVGTATSMEVHNILEEELNEKKP